LELELPERPPALAGRGQTVPLVLDERVEAVPPAWVELWEAVLLAWVEFVSAVELDYELLVPKNLVRHEAKMGNPMMLAGIVAAVQLVPLPGELYLMSIGYE
jgi:hypothetical protein